MRIDYEIHGSRSLERKRPWLGWREPGAKPVRGAFGWLGLIVVLTAASGLENALGSITLETRASARSSSSVSGTQSTPGRDGVFPIMITLHDRATATDTQWQCISTSDRAPAEELTVDANALADVAAALCGPTS